MSTAGTINELLGLLEAGTTLHGMREVGVSPDDLRAYLRARAEGREAVGRGEEAIVRLHDRPVLFVRDGLIEEPAIARWKATVEAANAKLTVEPLLGSVGRIDLANHTSAWVGTGWLCQKEDVVVTNRHVARLFASGRDGVFVFDRDPSGERQVEATVDFLHEQGRTAPRAFQILRVLHIDEGPGSADVAFLQVKPRGVNPDDRLGTPIMLAEGDVGEGTAVATVGYPGSDGQRNNPDVMARIFADTYEVKRFQPGEVMRLTGAYLTHDCSTLGGNSGSVLFDLATWRAVGLHYSGYYEGENFAVKASRVAEVMKARLDGRAPAPARAIATAGGEGTRGGLSFEVITTETIDRIGGRALESPEPPRGAASEGLTADEHRELIGLIMRAKTHLADAEESATDLGASPEDEVAARLQSWLRRNAEARAQVAALADEVKYDEHDLGWGVSLLNWLRGLKPHPMRRPMAGPETIGAKTRIAILGDWGSGLYAAPIVGQTVQRGDYQLAVHLGDVYYAGTEREVRDNFLRYWPERAGLVSRALNSNHEMYSGGYGYFKVTLPRFNQEGSYFAARNDHFLLIGLDTGYEDHTIDDEQATWLGRTLADAGPRKVILLSHHQLYSPGGEPVDKLFRRMDPFLRGQVFAWYWGHEHAAVMFDYDAKRRLYARCIGHSGFPYFRHAGAEPVEERLNGSRWRRLPGNGATPDALLLDDPNPYVDKPEKYGAQGFASLELDGAALIERVHRPDGQVIYEKQLCGEVAPPGPTVAAG